MASLPTSARPSPPERDPAWLGRVFWACAVLAVAWPLFVATEFRPWTLVEPDNLKVTRRFLADFLPPTASEIPPIEIRHLETLSTASITGAKGLGEGGTIGAPAAVINAICDALRPLGVEINEMPATPSRIRAAIRAAERKAA